MATASQAEQDDRVLTDHIVDRAVQFMAAIRRSVEIESAAMSTKALDPAIYEAFRRVSRSYADDAVKAAATLKDALDVTDEEWLEAWANAGERRKALTETFSKLGHEFILSARKADGPGTPDPAAVKAGTHDLLLAGVRVIGAVIKEDTNVG